MIKTLHTLNKGHSASGNIINRLISAACDHDCVLFQENGLYIILRDSQQGAIIRKKLRNNPLFYLISDREKRKLSKDDMMPNIIGIEFLEYVELTEINPRIISWF